MHVKTHCSVNEILIYCTLHYLHSVLSPIKFMFLGKKVGPFFNEIGTIENSHILVSIFDVYKPK